MIDGLSADITLADDSQTEAFGRVLARLVQPGDVLLLEGPIGSGKTHFCRALIQARLAAAGLSEDVPSPTFTLVQTYSDGACEIWHADLYRLSDPQEVSELGLDEAFDTAIVLVEWPDRLGDAAPSDALRLTFAVVGDGRRVTLTSPSNRWSRLMTEFESIP